MSLWCGGRLRPMDEHREPPVESVHSPAASAHISHAVIATYAAAAAVEVEGVHAIADAPLPCRGCMWWQTRPGGRPGDRTRWAHDVEDDFGPWGKLYLDDGRVI